MSVLGKGENRAGVKRHRPLINLGAFGENNNESVIYENR